jgi:SAM-dependent methyltransferase
MPHTIEKRLSTPRPDTRTRVSEVAPTAPPSTGRDSDYVPFGNMESRNGLQERLEIPLLVRALGLPRGGRVLEVGCGRGVALPVLAERLQPSSLVGVDVDGALVEIARRRIVRSGTRAEVRTADVRALPFESGSFDVVIDFGTCYHVGGGASGRLAALHEIIRVLCVGGLFVHETRVAQHLAHPIRSLGRRLPWLAVPLLAPEREAVLWTARRRLAPACPS